MKTGWTCVTGGAKRLGRQIALSLAKHGHSIALHYNESKSEAEDVAAACRSFGGRAETIQGDFSTRENVNDFLSEYLDRFPETSHFVHNVGKTLSKDTLATTHEEWAALFQINFFSALQILQELSPSLRKAQGSITTIGVAGLQRFSGSTKICAYQVTKEALWHVTQSLARELGKEGVRVNMVSPGYLESTTLQPQRPIPLGRLGTFQEVADLVVFLTGERALYISGQNIEVSGGLS